MFITPIFSDTSDPLDNYPILNSLRCKSASVTYLSRQNGGSDGDRKKASLSFWIHPTAISTVGTPGDGPHIFMIANAAPGSSPSNYMRLLLTGPTGNQLVLQSSGSAGEAFTSTPLYRDPTAAMHVLLTLDNANTAVKCYVDGTEISYASRTNPSNINGLINSASNYMRFGMFITSDVRGFDGYLSEIHFVDGQVLLPSDFGYTNSENQWRPKAYSGTYGTCGFYLKFNDNSSLVNLAKDRSGNGNDWTATNFSVTAGVTNDWLQHTPTKNYPLMNLLDSSASGTLSAGNLTWTAGAAQCCVRSTQPIPSSGLFYAEATVGSSTTGSIACSFGLATSIVALNSSNLAVGLYNLYFNNTGILSLNNSNITTGLGAATAGDILQIAVDATNNKLWLGKNNTWYDSSGGTTGNPSTGANATVSSLPAGLFIFSNCYSNSISWNFGQRSFSYTAPTGFDSLNTKNLPTNGGTITTSGTFTGNASTTESPCVWLNGTPLTMTINGNAVTFGTHVDRLAGGFKLRTSSASYNASGSNTYSITSTGTKFRYSNSKSNP